MGVLVSIVCNTYNHEKFIRDSIEGFVNQIVDFDYEILIYDDASTDSTADIIREYEIKYPHLINPIYQTINQYSQGLDPGQQNRNRATGKYIAICEGDDYWIDNRKLQKQVDYMESHPGCTFCFTNGFLRYGDRIDENDFVIPINRSAVVKADGNDYNVAEIDLLEYIPTASILFLRELEQWEMPNGAFLGDIYLRLWATSYGYAHFINESTCVYRRAVSTSATAKIARDEKKMIDHCDSMILFYQGAKKNLPEKYWNIMDMRCCQWKITRAYTLNDLNTLKLIRFSGDMKLLRYSNRYSKSLYTLQCKYPKLYRLLRLIIKRILKSYNR